jgi:uracil-DNA glycosylase family 4
VTRAPRSSRQGDSSGTTRRTAHARATGDSALAPVSRRIERCDRCPELRAYCSDVARTKRRAYASEDYWGRPVPGFGDARARIWILGLAPGAHGANRTGRVFTGDRAGDFLYAALHRAGLANQPRSTARDDGLELWGVWISAALRCAPPANKPTRAQLDRCAEHLDREWEALADARLLLCLGGIAWDAALGLLARRGVTIPQPRPRFAHGAGGDFGERVLLASYHVSQQNTFTGRLTPAMLDRVLAEAMRRAAE